jgi:hypothetical protein
MLLFRTVSVKDKVGSIIETRLDYPSFQPKESVDLVFICKIHRGRIQNIIQSNTRYGLSLFNNFNSRQFIMQKDGLVPRKSKATRLQTV